MKKFIRQVVIFSLAIFLMLLLGQFLVDLRTRHKNIGMNDNLDVIRGQENELIFLGSSRCYMHFDPALFEETLHVTAVNLGMLGHSGLSMHKLRLLNYLAKNKTPRFAILSFDALVRPGSVENNTDMYNKDEFARYAFFPSAVNEPIVRCFKFDLLERYVPLYALLKYKRFPDCLTLPYARQYSINRYFKRDEKWDTLAHPADPKQAYENAFDTSASGLIRIELALKSLDSLCDQHNIRLICVQTPVYKAIYNDRFFCLTRLICSHLDLPFFDANYRQISDSADNFYDAGHMNTRGVRKMTSLLLSEAGFRQLFYATNSHR
jgi:hypothetical protein